RARAAAGPEFGPGRAETEHHRRGVPLAGGAAGRVHTRLVAQRATLRVGHVTDQDDDAVDQSPDGAQPTRQEGDHKLENPDGGVSQVETADAEAAEEDAQ